MILVTMANRVARNPALVTYLRTVALVVRRMLFPPLFWQGPELNKVTFLLPDHREKAEQSRKETISAFKDPATEIM